MARRPRPTDGLQSVCLCQQNHSYLTSLTSFNDQLLAARAELRHLESREEKLLGQLANVRAAMQTQRRRVDELIRSGTPPIHRIPNESLLQIIDLAIRANRCALPRIWRKSDLAVVSRHWRKLIFGSPKLWTEISLEGRLHPSVVRMHATRSRACLVDVSIDGRLFKEKELQLSEMLDAVLSCASRWRSFKVHKFDPDEGTLDIISSRVNRLRSFPSLSSVDIPAGLFLAGVRTGYLPFDKLNAPQLKHAVLEAPTDDLDLPPDLETLSLTLPEHIDESLAPALAIPNSILPQTLRVLSLSGNIDRWCLLPNSINLPLLEKATLHATASNKFLASLVAPQLRHCDYRPRLQYRQVTSSVYLDSVHSSVETLSFWLFGKPNNCFGEACAFALAFPNVRHVQLDPAYISDVFGTHDGFCIADQWRELRTITFLEADTETSQTLNAFLLWLQHRRNSGQPGIHVIFTEFYPDDTSECYENWLSTFQLLHEYCTLEFEDIVFRPTLIVYGNIDVPSSIKVVCILLTSLQPN